MYSTLPRLDNKEIRKLVCSWNVKSYSETGNTDKYRYQRKFEALKT